jgi:phospholipase/lecithinase/hemolysin
MYFSSGRKPDAGTLFVLWGGANDFFDGQRDPSVPAANLAANLTALAKAGATNFLVPNLPPLGDTPFGRTLSPEARQGLNALVNGFNTLLDHELGQLQNDLSGVHIHRLDVFGLLQKVLANPSDFGFTNVTHSALEDGVRDGQGYLFWDPVHPTIAGHQLVGDQAFGALSTPEPSTVVLLGGGVLVLLGYAWRQRRNAA